MKPFITIMVALFFSLQASTQNTLSGKVLDKETQESLPGATIYFPDLQKGTSTNADGFFEIKNLPEGTFMVEVGFISYSNQVLSVTIKGKTILNIELTSSITEISEVVITGASASTERKLNPIPTVVIKDISTNQTSATNIIDALAKQPGISQVTTGGAISKPVIRGLGFSRVVVLNNNIRQEGQQWGEEHGIEIDEYAVDRVEIIKGPGSLMYGSDAMAGVINFLGPKPLENGKIISQVISNYQSNNNLLGYSVMNSGNLKGFNWLIRTSMKRAGNYSNTYDGKVYNSGFEELNVNGTIGVNKKWGYSQINFSSFNQSLGLVEGERDSLGGFIKLVVVDDTTIKQQSVNSSDLDGYELAIPNQKINHLRVSSNNKFFFKTTSLSVNIAFQQNQRKEFTDLFDEQAIELFFLLNTFNYNIKYMLPEIKGWQSSIGVNGMQQTSLNKGKEFLIPEYSLLDGGLFAFTQKKMNKLYVGGGLRYDLRSINSASLYLNSDDEPTEVLDSLTNIKFNDFNASFTNVSASVGVSYQHTKKLTTKFNVSRGFRSPNIGELASNGIHEGTFRYELGNQQLKSETSLQADLGFLYNSEHVSFEVALFNNAIQNFIFLQKLNSVAGGDSVIDISDPAPTFQFVQGNANLYGGEIAIDIHPHPMDWLHFENSFSFVRGEQLNQPDSTKDLPFIPAPRIQSELRADFKPKNKRYNNLYIKVSAVHTFAQNHIFSAFETETTTPAYTLLNAGMGSEFLNKKGTPLFSINLSINNVLDIGYQSHLSRLKYASENLVPGRRGVFNMGRSFSVKLIVPLTHKSKPNNSI